MNNMIKYLFIDSNCTIENDLSFLKADRAYFEKIARILNCTSYDVQCFLEQFKQSYGKSLWEYHEIFWRALTNKYGYNNSREKIDELYECFLDFYEEKIDVYPDTIKTLAKLSKEYKLIMVANGNSRRVQRLINKFGLNEYFDDFVISSETPYKKPDKFMFEYELKLKGIKPEEVVMIGDRVDNDIKGAMACGLYTILIDRKIEKTTLGHISDFVVPNISKAYTVLKKIKNAGPKSAKSVFLLNSETTDESLTAFVAAGGKGSRLGELGTKKQKCMLEIWDNKPILEYVISILRSVGCRKIVLAVSHLKEQIIDYFKDGSKFGVKIEYATGAYKSTYDAIYSTLPMLTDKFIYIHGDILFNPELLWRLVQTEKKKNGGCVGLINNANIHLTHAQMDIKNGKVTNIDLTERDEHFPFTFIGVGVYNKADFVDNFDGETTGMVEKHILQKLNNNKSTAAVVYEGGWRHFETIDDYYRAKNEPEWATLCEGGNK